ncbi:hypothetical protein [Enterococcus mundtii]|uniref:hypothetical protein n=1 Tax=Enterococcus mundtii TaxID=53346 RepID=UPI00321936E9
MTKSTVMLKSVAKNASEALYFIDNTRLYHWFTLDDFSNRMSAVGVPENLDVVAYFIIYFNEEIVGLTFCIDLSKLPDYKKQFYSDLLTSYQSKKVFELCTVFGQKNLYSKSLGIYNQILPAIERELLQIDGHILIINTDLDNHASTRFLQLSAYEMLKDNIYYKELA